MKKTTLLRKALEEKALFPPAHPNGIFLGVTQIPPRGLRPRWTPLGSFACQATTPSIRASALLGDSEPGTVQTIFPSSPPQRAYRGADRQVFERAGQAQDTARPHQRGSAPSGLPLVHLPARPTPSIRASALLGDSEPGTVQTIFPSSPPQRAYRGADRQVFERAGQAQDTARPQLKGLRPLWTPLTDQGAPFVRLRAGAGTRALIGRVAPPVSLPASLPHASQPTGP